MRKTKIKKRQVGIAAIVGAFSGAISYLLAGGQLLFFAPGFVFGITVVIYFYNINSDREVPFSADNQTLHPGWVLLFMFGSMLAYFIAFSLAAGTFDIGIGRSAEPAMPNFFRLVAGGVGALVVYEFFRRLVSSSRIEFSFSVLLFGALPLVLFYIPESFIS